MDARQDGLLLSRYAIDDDKAEETFAEAFAQMNLLRKDLWHETTRRLDKFLKFFDAEGKRKALVGHKAVSRKMVKVEGSKWIKEREVRTEILSKASTAPLAERKKIFKAYMELKKIGVITNEEIRALKKELKL